MRINIGFGTFVDVIEFEPFLGENLELLENYKSEFYEWFHFKRIPSKEDPNKLVYREDIYPNCNAIPIVAWMNEVAPECNAKIIAQGIKPGNEDKSLPYMHF